MTIEAVTGQTSLVTSGGTIILGLNISEWGLVFPAIGAACAIITCGAYIYFNYKRKK